MTVKEFVDKYNKSQRKVETLKTLKSKKYIPYEEKIELCNRTIKSCCYRETNGKKEFYVNTPSKFMVFSLGLIDAYTDVNVDFKNALAEFNMLDEAGLIDGILEKCVPTSEHQRMDVIMKMVTDDLYENERSFISVAERFAIDVEAVMEAIDGFMEKIPKKPKLLK